MKRIELRGHDYSDLLKTLNEAYFSLDVLGQLQKCAGGLSMDERAQGTFEVRARLGRFISMLEHRAGERLNDNE
jgi:hypothetical protein